MTVKIVLRPRALDSELTTKIDSVFMVMILKSDFGARFQDLRMSPNTDSNLCFADLGNSVGPDI